MHSEVWFICFRDRTTPTTTAATRTTLEMPPQIYFMPGSEAEATRLNEQGLLFEAALDYAIHPDIIARLPSKPCIADIGTGTGDYVVRLSQDYPTDSEFYGFDISSGCFFVEDALPKNVKLCVHDIRQPFPTEFHNKFDLVHLRLLVGGLQENDWITATQNILQILRPGGAVQWEENDPVGSRVVRGGRVGSSTQNLQLLISPLVALYKDRFMHGYSLLPKVFQEVGLQGIVQDIVSNDRVVENRKKQGSIGIRAIQHWVINMKAMGKAADFWPGHQLEDLVRKAYEDVEDGAYSRYDIFATIGFKPQ